MKPVLWIIYLLSLFGVGWVLGALTYKPPPKKTRQKPKAKPAQSTHMDLDFTFPDERRK